MHWHGLRLDNRYDGTHETQAPIPVGGTVHLPDRVPRPRRLLVPPAHPRGLRPGDGPVRQHPRRPGRRRTTGRRSHRELLLTLDDVLIEDGTDRAVQPRPRRPTRRWAASATSCSSPARPSFRSRAQPGEVVRLYLTNTANTRVFNVALPGARMKLVGGDSGRYEHEEFVESVDPRAVGARRRRRAASTSRDELTLEHRTPERTYALATIDVGARAGDAVARRRSSTSCATNPEWAAERERLAPYFDAPPDKTLAFVAEMDMGDARGRRSSTPARCTPSGQRRARTAARSAA